METILSKITTEKSTYQVIEKLGKGSFGSVYKVIKILTKFQYAMKVIDISKNSKDSQLYAMFEAKVLEGLKHPNIIEFKETHFDLEQKKFYMFMEIAPMGDLNMEIK